MGVDEARDDQLSASFDYAMAIAWQARTHGFDYITFDEDVGRGRAMDITIVVIDLPASNKSFHHLTSVHVSCNPNNHQPKGTTVRAAELVPWRLSPQDMSGLIKLGGALCCARPV
jgi:hypothetical protein